MIAETFTCSEILTTVARGMDAATDTHEDAITSARLTRRPERRVRADRFSPSIKDRLALGGACSMRGCAWRIES